MSSRTLFPKVFALILIALLLAGCGGVPAGPTPAPTPVPPTPTPTPVPPTTTPTPIPPTPTPTPIPPTPTPSCEVVCDYDSLNENLSITITCESGPSKQSTSVFFEGGKKHIAGQRTYETSGNTYDITAVLFAEGGKWNVTVEATGGVFGETLQTCECSD